ncbi:mite allergen Der f 3-like [Leguminivora glycinivorella]|uniref:mite allergen Der f 3-like n=1 Tax=Leguminivora glycinivorella TaxID=1035111 RepID=UPI00200FF614|nr:mite allergen Der f 3-like [Leguminivora glycinivorella]
MTAIGLFAFVYAFKLVIGKQEGFIVGGAVVHAIAKFPHVAFLALYKDSNDEYMCGSSILNQWILITAAHCFDDIVKAHASVGNVNRATGKLYRVESYRQHEKWDTVKVHYDIALCKLKKPIQFGHSVKRVLMVKRPPKASVGDLAGWGATEEKEYTESVQLKHTRQKLWNHNQCKKVLSRVPRGTICGGEARSRGNYASKGDSGSGLLVDNKIIIGLVSYKDPYVSRSLVIYTDVPYFYDWIQRTTRELECSWGY